jgi:putative acetyltransferase
MKEQWAKELYVRGERASDHVDILEINRLAFGREDEGKLIDDVRKTKNFEFGFSLVAVKEDKILGHALFSKAFVVHKGRRFKCLALGPIAVLPEHQRKGIGKALIAEGFERAKEVGFGAVVVLGDPAYFEQFGFKPSSVYKVRCSFSPSPEYFMVKEISRNAMRGIIGTVQYAREFLTLAEADKKRAEEKAKEIPQTDVMEQIGPVAQAENITGGDPVNAVSENIPVTVNTDETINPVNEHENTVNEVIQPENKTTTEESTDKSDENETVV